MFEDFSNIDAENIIVGTVKQKLKKSRKIEDFGEKIGGARKDLYAAYCDLIKVPLSKSFPASNYKKFLESGVECWKVDEII